MVTYWRAAWWALSFGAFLHIGLDEHQSLIRSFLTAVFWTAVVDRLTSGAVGPREPDPLDNDGNGLTASRVFEERRNRHAAR